MKARSKPQASGPSRTRIGKKRRARDQQASRDERTSRATRRSSSSSSSKASATPDHHAGPAIDGSSPRSPTTAKYLCLTICGYRKPGMSEEDYRNHMVNVSAPMTKGLMAKYGIKRWTQIHNQTATRALMPQLFDPQMCNVADFDCFSQVVFERLEDYKALKRDAWYKEHLVRDHERFADTKRSMMTIGWIEEFVRDGEVV